MRTKILFISLIGLALTYFIWQRNNTQAESQQTVSAQPISSVANNEQNDTANQADTEIAIKQVAKVSPAKAEPSLLADTSYSSDPVVNTYSIYQNNKMCYFQLENNKDSSVIRQQILQMLDPKQVAHINNHLDYCRQLDREHPEYSLGNRQQMLERLGKSKANSLWGKILNREIAEQDLTQSEIKDLLSSQDINILQDAPRLLNSHYQEVVHWDLESYLGNHDYDYVTYIRDYAHQLYLCNLGAACDANSTLMVSLCIQEKSACGTDFPTHINNFLSSAQQADIQLALAYLRSQYQ